MLDIFFKDFRLRLEILIREVSRGAKEERGNKVDNEACISGYKESGTYLLKIYGKLLPFLEFPKNGS